MTTRLNPEIAQMFGTTPSSVERGIRFACERAFATAPSEALETVFGNTLNKKRPTNQHFIAAIAKAIKYNEIPMEEDDNA